MSSVINYYLICINIISFLIYYIDKRLAIKHKYRVPENILILVSLIGGVLGSLISMMLFHHKTKHLKFIIMNPVILVIWLYILFKFL